MESPRRGLYQLGRVEHRFRGGLDAGRIERALPAVCNRAEPFVPVRCPVPYDESDPETQPSLV
jgi:hypothetical protein